MNAAIIFWASFAIYRHGQRVHMDVSKNSGIPKSSILMGFSIINHPFWGTPIFGNINMTMLKGMLTSLALHDTTTLGKLCRGAFCSDVSSTWCFSDLKSFFNKKPRHHQDYQVYVIINLSLYSVLYINVILFIFLRPRPHTKALTCTPWYIGCVKNTHDYSWGDLHGWTINSPSEVFGNNTPWRAEGL